MARAGRQGGDLPAPGTGGRVSEEGICRRQDEGHAVDMRQMQGAGRGASGIAYAEVEVMAGGPFGEGMRVRTDDGLRPVRHDEADKQEHTRPDPAWFWAGRWS